MLASTNYSNQEDIIALRNRHRERFIAERTKREQAFVAWHSNLMKCNQNGILDTLEFDYANMTLQSLIPEWYVEKPNAEVARQQVEAANAKLKQINDIFIELNKEALAALKEFDALYSGQAVGR